MAGEIWIVVLTYNHWQDTRACLQSVFTEPRANLKVLVVDNGSTDETRAVVCQQFPVQLIENATNLGYAQGNNVGICHALAHGAEFVMVLNNDVTVEQHWLEPLLDAARADSRAALVGPLVYHADEPNVIQSAGGILPWDWRALHRGANEVDRGQFDTTTQVDWLTGCCILARARALQEIGWLDETLYMYGEDLDWCIRARRAGYHMLLVPDSRVWHKGVKRDYAPAPHVTYYTVRNELRLQRKHHAGWRATTFTWLRHVRTLVTWSVSPRWKNKLSHRDALARALLDFMRGNFGAATLP